MSFHPVCRGDRIQLKEDNTIARRTDSYNGGIVYSAEPLEIGDLFQIRLDAMEKGWAGSLKFGITSRDPVGLAVPKGILELYNRSDFWVLSGEKLHHNHSERSYKGPSLESLRDGDTVGLYVSQEGDLHFVVKGDDKGAVISSIPTDVPLFVVADIYGQAKQISIVGLFSRDVEMKDVEPFPEAAVVWPHFSTPMSSFLLQDNEATSSCESSDEDDDSEGDSSDIGDEESEDGRTG